MSAGRSRNSDGMERHTVIVSHPVGIPSTILLLRTGGVLVPLPWLLVWLLLVPLLPFCWLAGYVGRPWLDSRSSFLLREAHQVLRILAGLRGLTVSVTKAGSSDGTDVFLRWI